MKKILQSLFVITALLVFSLQTSCLRNVREMVPGKWELSGLDCNSRGENCKQLATKRIIVQLDDKRVYIEGKPYPYTLKGNIIRIYQGKLFNEGKLIFLNDDTVILKSKFLKEIVYFKLKRVTVEPLNELEKLMVGTWQITAKNCDKDGRCTQKHSGPLMFFLYSRRVMDHSTSETIRFYIKKNVLTLINHDNKKKIWHIKFISKDKVVLTTPGDAKKTYLLEKIH